MPTSSPAATEEYAPNLARTWFPDRFWSSSTAFGEHIVSDPFVRLAESLSAGESSPYIAYAISISCTGLVTLRCRARILRSARFFAQPAAIFIATSSSAVATLLVAPV